MLVDHCRLDALCTDVAELVATPDTGHVIAAVQLDQPATKRDQLTATRKLHVAPFWVDKTRTFQFQFQYPIKSFESFFYSPSNFLN